VWKSDIVVAFCSLLIWVCSFDFFGPIDNANLLLSFMFGFLFTLFYLKFLRLFYSLLILGIGFEICYFIVLERVSILPSFYILNACF